MSFIDDDDGEEKRRRNQGQWRDPERPVSEQKIQNWQMRPQQAPAPKTPEERALKETERMMRPEMEAAGFSNPIAYVAHLGARRSSDPREARMQEMFRREVVPGAAAGGRRDGAAGDERGRFVQVQNRQEGPTPLKPWQIFEDESIEPMRSEDDPYKTGPFLIERPKAPKPEAQVSPPAKDHRPAMHPNSKWILERQPDGRYRYQLIDPQTNRVLGDDQGRPYTAQPLEVDELPAHMRRDAAELRKLWSVPDGWTGGDSPEAYALMKEMKDVRSMSPMQRANLKKRIDELFAIHGREWTPLVGRLKARIDRAHREPFHFPRLLSDEELDNFIPVLERITVGSTAATFGQSIPEVQNVFKLPGRLGGLYAAWLTLLTATNLKHHETILRRLLEEKERRAFERKYPRSQD